MTPDLMPYTDDDLSTYIARVDPALSRRLENIVNPQSCADGYAMGLWAALYELRDVPPGSETDVLVAVIHALMRQRNSRRLVRALLSESEMQAAERLIDECEAEDSSLAPSEDVDPGFGDDDIERAEDTTTEET
jgi:hypothetical protein